MKWYHFTVEYFEDLRNIDHCEFLTMRLQDNGKYLLETKLRTWSEMRQEKALAAKGNSDKEETKDDVKLARNKTFIAPRKWGGCPDGCNHTPHYKKRPELEALREREQERETASNNKYRQRRPRMVISSDEEGPESEDEIDPKQTVPASKSKDENPAVSITRTSTIVEESSTTNEAAVAYLKKTNPHLHVGRDFGGTYSGHASTVGSDTDGSDDERLRMHRLASLNARLKVTGSAGHARNYSIDSNASAVAPGPGPFVNRLGDAPPFSDSGMDDADPIPAAIAAKQLKKAEQRKKDKDEEFETVEELDAAEAEDRSIRGSVY